MDVAGRGVVPDARPQIDRIDIAVRCPFAAGASERFARRLEIFTMPIRLQPHLRIAEVADDIPQVGPRPGGSVFTCSPVATRLPLLLRRAGQLRQTTVDGRL